MSERTFLITVWVSMILFCLTAWTAVVLAGVVLLRKLGVA